MHRLGGLARQVRYINKQRSLGNSLVINGGAAFFPPADIKLESPAHKDAVINARLIAKVLRLQKTNVYAPGPQDFLHGAQTFAQLAKIAQMPLLSSNLVDNKTHKATYKIFARLQQGPVPLLIIALQDPKNWPQKSSGLHTKDPILSAQQILANQARPGDVVILIAGSDMDTAQKWAKKLPELSAVLVAQRSMMSFFPREFVRPDEKGRIDGSSLPMMAAGHSGAQLIQMDIFYQSGDSLLRGGAVFEDARDQIAQARKMLKHKALDSEAQQQMQRAQKILHRQKDRTHYRYRYVEMDMHKAENAQAKKILTNKIIK